MPQLDKLTYLTQFFWSCLFLFTFYISVRFYPFDLEVKVFCFYLRKPFLQKSLSIFKYLIISIYVLRTGFTFYENFTSLIFSDSVFCVLPNEAGHTGSGPSSSGPLPDLNKPALLPTDEELASESEANAAECKRLTNLICEQASKIAQRAGVGEPDKLGKIQDAIRYLTDYDDLDEEARIPLLNDFLANKIHQNETWQEIDRHLKKWGGKGLC